ncbi:MAG: nucleoside triphosphate pyrophosphatase [Pirellulaceae bacterium]|nr:nucleoside triphosphate pyrophosphatase [Pirellulaceae bacterium]
MTAHPLILASTSPRRRQLLAEAGYQFQVIPPDDSAESGEVAGETPAELVVRMARQKAADVAQRVSAGLVIGCDTVAECDGVVLGKPRDLNHAREMLQLLRGRHHRVLSGLCLWQRPENQIRLALDTTVLRMQDFTDTALENHLASGDWRGKAGAFGFQDGLDWVEVVEGSVSNVVGLPMELLAQLCKEIPG